jgi:hypothetical protein
MLSGVEASGRTQSSNCIIDDEILQLLFQNSSYIVMLSGAEASERTQHADRIIDDEILQLRFQNGGYVEDG